MYKLIEDVMGYPQAGGVVPTEVVPTGSVLSAIDPIFGGGELIFVKALTTIPVWAAVIITPTWNATLLKYENIVAAVPNTANQSRSIAVVAQAMVSGDYGWAVISGTAPVSSTASVAAGVGVGVAAAGQLGAAAAGKNVFGAVSIAPSTTTVVKAATGVTLNNKVLKVPNTSGLFVGQIASGTGIAALSIVTAIDELKQEVTIAVNPTATGSVSVTFTNQDGTIFYNTIAMQRPSLTNITV